MDMLSGKRGCVDLLLLDFNPCDPPVYPLGLEAIAHSVRNAGFEVALLSASPRLADYADQSCVLEAFLPKCIGLQIRNFDHGVAGARLPRMHEFYRIVVARLRHLFAGVPLVFGGMGFSIDPEYWIREYQPDFGIVGSGERAMVQLLLSLGRHQSGIDRIPNLACVNRTHVAPSVHHCAGDLPAVERSPTELARWVIHCGSTPESIPWANVETSRGCWHNCRFCVEPRIHGGPLAIKPVDSVLQELQTLVATGVRRVFFCASEFNLDKSHCLALCRGLASTGLGRQLSWSTYVSPVQMDRALAQEMRIAGCQSVSINAVHSSDSVLEWFHCPHDSRDLRLAIESFEGTGIEYRSTFLLGAPPETDSTIDGLFDFIRHHKIRATVAVGLACYPNLDLGSELKLHFYSGSPVPYAIHLSAEQLTRISQFIARMPDVRLANGTMENVTRL